MRLLCGGDAAARRLHLGLAARQADRDQFERHHQAGSAGQAAARRRATDPAESRGLPGTAAAEEAVKKLLFAAAALLSLAVPAAALAQDPAAILAGRRAGLIGERYDGYVGVVSPNTSAEMRRQVAALNIRRRS